MNDLTFGRPFVLRRDRDVSSVSGTGIIADGIVFPDGHAAIHWRGRWPLTMPHPDGLESILAIHDHGGRGDLHVIWPQQSTKGREILAAAVGRAYALAGRWEAAHGSSMFLVNAAGAELRDVLDDSGTDPAEVVHLTTNDQVTAMSGVDDIEAAECSALHRGFDDGRQCIRAAQHRGDHIDERGFHWSDTVAVYPVAGDQLPPNQGPLTGIEVRDPCPHCEDCRLVPRRQMMVHLREQHPGATCDFPLGWRVAKAYAFDEHDPKCSYTRTRGALLCDCHVLFPEQRSNSSLRKRIDEAIGDAWQAGLNHSSGERVRREIGDAVMAIVDPALAAAENSCDLPHEMEA